jgi:hypothetical protein
MFEIQRLLLHARATGKGEGDKLVWEEARAVAYRYGTGNNRSCLMGCSKFKDCFFTRELREKVRGR